MNIVDHGNNLVKKEVDDMNIDDNIVASIKEMKIWSKEPVLEMGNAREDKIHASKNKSCYNSEIEVPIHSRVKRVSTQALKLRECPFDSCNYKGIPGSVRIFPLV